MSLLRLCHAAEHSILFLSSAAEFRDRLHTFPRPLITGIEVQCPLKEGVCLLEITDVQITHTEVTEGERILRIQIERALEGDDSLDALLAIEQGPPEATEDLGVIRLHAIRELQLLE